MSLPYEQTGFAEYCNAYQIIFVKHLQLMWTEGTQCKTKVNNNNKKEEEKSVLNQENNETLHAN